MELVDQQCHVPAHLRLQSGLMSDGQCEQIDERASDHPRDVRADLFLGDVNYHDCTIADPAERIDRGSRLSYDCPGGQVRRKLVRLGLDGVDDLRAETSVQWIEIRPPECLNLRIW